MTLIVQCDRCGKTLRAKDCYAGMPTRCPQCNTINQLPSPSSAASGSEVPSKGVGGHKAGTARQPSPPEPCTICGKPIRGRAERFADVHGNLYHLGCYQQQAGEASDEVCRICQRPFERTRERVKDVLGFFYHRDCYYEKLEQQKLAALGGAPEGDARPAPAIPAKAMPDVKGSKDRAPHSQPSGNDDDDWNLTDEADTDWMRPDPDELEVNEKAKPLPSPPSAIPSAAGPDAQAANRPATPTARPQPRGSATPAGTTRPAGAQKKTPSPSVPRTQPARLATPPTKSARPQPDQSKPAAPRPKESLKPVPASPSTGTGGSNRQPPKTPSTAGAEKKAAPAQPKPPQPARPVNQQPLAAAIVLPEGLEMLPDEPASSPDSLERLLGLTQPGTVDGPEVVDEVEAIPMAQIVGGPSPSTQPLSAGGAAPAGLSPFGVPTSGDPFQSTLLDPLTDASPAGYRRRHSSNAIPTWLWALMGAGVGVVVIMLLATVANFVWTSHKNEQPLAQSGPSDTGQTAPVQNIPPSQENPSYEAWRENVLERNGYHDSRTRGRQQSPGTRNAAGRAYQTGFLVGIAVGLCIFLLIDALILRLASSLCGESDVSWGKSVLICFLQQVVLFFLTLGSTSYFSSFMISVVGRICVGTALVRFLLPTSAGRGIAIAVCHLVITVLIGATLLVLGIFLLTLASGPAR